jgi:hypothetical protein
MLKNMYRTFKRYRRGPVEGVNGFEEDVRSEVRNIRNLLSNYCDMTGARFYPVDWARRGDVEVTVYFSPLEGKIGKIKTIVDGWLSVPEKV